MVWYLGKIVCCDMAAHTLILAPNMYSWSCGSVAWVAQWLMHSEVNIYVYPKSSAGIFLIPILLRFRLAHLHNLVDLHMGWHGTTRPRPTIGIP